MFGSHPDVSCSTVFILLIIKLWLLTPFSWNKMKNILTSCATASGEDMKQSCSSSSPTCHLWKMWWAFLLWIVPSIHVQVKHILIIIYDICKILLQISLSFITVGTCSIQWKSVHYLQWQWLKHNAIHCTLLLKNLLYLELQKFQMLFQVNLIIKNMRAW